MSRVSRFLFAALLFASLIGTFTNAASVSAAEKKAEQLAKEILVLQFRIEELRLSMEKYLRGK